MAGKANEVADGCVIFQARAAQRRGDAAKRIGGFWAERRVEGFETRRGSEDAFDVSIYLRLAVRVLLGEDDLCPKMVREKKGPETL